MIINIKDLKNKIIYRSRYRGTKEMDTLLGSFTQIHINQLTDDELTMLSDLLDLDDENLYKFNNGFEIEIKIEKNRVTELFKKYEYVSG